MKKSINLSYVVLAICLVVVAVIGLSLAANGKTSAVTCQQIGKLFSVNIAHDTSDNNMITGQACDQIRFKNVDKTQVYGVAFGPHDEHEPYDGVSEKVLKPGETLTITLNQIGKFHWHDHLKDVAEGYFTVQRK